MNFIEQMRKENKLNHWGIKALLRTACNSLVMLEPELMAINQLPNNLTPVQTLYYNNMEK